MPQINASLPSSPHRNRTPTLFDCCVMSGWRWFVPYGVVLSQSYPRRVSLRTYSKNKRRMIQPPPPIAKTRGICIILTILDAAIFLLGWNRDRDKWSIDVRS